MVDSGVSGGEGVRNMAVKMEGFVNKRQFDFPHL